jgi:hypothetical protein
MVYSYYEETILSDQLKEQKYKPLPSENDDEK